MTGFGDFDPEDAYDAGDPPAERLRIIERVAAALEMTPAADPRRVARRDDALRLVLHLGRVRHVDHGRLARVRDRLEAIG